MLEKYFIWGGLAAFLLITAGILGGTIVYWRFRHIKKLIQLNMLRRQQIFGETHFFSAAVLDMAASRLLFSFYPGRTSGSDIADSRTRRQSRGVF